MMELSKLFSEELKIMNIGSPSFTKDYESQGIEYTHLEWKMPANGDEDVLSALKNIYKHKDEIDEANKLAIENIKSSTARLIGVKKAIECVPNMDKYTILHAGPPIEWSRMSGPAKGAIVGALIYEELANTQKEALELIESGKITFAPCHEYCVVGPMAGIVSASMPMQILYNEAFHTYSYSTINEGLGKVLRFGANSEEVINRLKWLENIFAPVINEAIENAKGIDIKNIIIQALQMGDECHNRNKAATALFLKEITMHILKTNFDMEILQEVIDFLINNEHYFLNLSMAACKITLDSAANIEKSSLVNIMARNGVDFGIKVSGLGNKWYMAPANYVEGLYFAGYSQDDAAKDIGDSAITETFGIGGFSMGVAPAIVQFVGGNVSDALSYTESMYEITITENKQFMLPAVNFKGIPQGIDLLKVVETGILPIINTGIAHKNAGVGQIGAGVVSPPFDVFKDAILDFSKCLEDVEAYV